MAQAQANVAVKEVQLVIVGQHHQRQAVEEFLRRQPQPLAVQAAQLPVNGRRAPGALVHGGEHAEIVKGGQQLLLVAVLQRPQIGFVAGEQLGVIELFPPAQRPGPVADLAQVRRLPLQFPHQATDGTISAEALGFR